MKNITIEIKKLHPDAVIPKYAHGPEEDAGFDLVAVEHVTLYPHVPVLVRTGLSISLPPGYEAQIRSRSGMALKQGVTVHNAPGTIDPSYRGEIGVILCWNGFMPQYYGCMYADKYQINPGDRVAQVVVAEYAAAVFQVTDTLQDSTRGEGGFGSSGK